MESSSSERRDKSEESRSGGTQDRPRRGGRRVARPMTPPHRPPPPSISPRRSPRLTTSAVRECPQSTVSDPPEPRSNAEWHSALQTKSRARNGINRIVCRSFRWKRVGAWPNRPGDQDLEARQRRCYSCHHLLLMILFHPSLEGGGVSGNAWRRHPSRFFPYGNWDRDELGDETEGCPRSESAIRHERGHPK